MVRKRILTICEGGNVRSVCLATMLKVLGYHNAIAIGANHALADFNGRQPGFMLCEWAEMIVIMSEHFASGVPIPTEHKHKVVICEVGRDTYGTPAAQDLKDKCYNWAQAQGLLDPVLCPKRC